MKQQLLFLCTLLFAFQGIAQENKMTIEELDTLIESDKLKTDYGLSEEQYRIILKKQFGAVINSSGKTTIGNYASADITDGELAFNATKNFKNGHMLSFNLNGGITDGLFTIFNETELNSNIGADMKFNWLFRKGSYIGYRSKQPQLLKTTLDRIETKYGFHNAIFSHQAEVLTKEENLIRQKMSTTTGQLEETGLTSIKKAELEYQLSELQLALDSVQLKLLTLETKDEIEAANKKLKKKAALEAIESFEYGTIRFQWMSFGAGFQNNNFNLFQSDFSSVDSQLVKQNYTTFNAKIEYNLYRWDQYSKWKRYNTPSYYWLLGAEFNVADNFDDLSKVELSDTRQYGDSTVQRSVSKKITAYRGDYETSLIGARFYTDFYLFFLGNSAAIHIYPEARIQQNSTPVYNAGIGLLYSFMDAKDEKNKNKLNAELYFRLYDLSNSRNSDLETLERNELGIRLSIPIAFFNF